MTVGLVIATLGIARHYHSGAQLDQALVTYGKILSKQKPHTLKSSQFSQRDYMSKIPQDSPKSDLLSVKGSSGISE